MLGLPAGKLLVLDKGFQSSEPDEAGLFSIPNDRDPPELVLSKLVSGSATRLSILVSNTIKFYKTHSALLEKSTGTLFVQFVFKYNTQWKVALSCLIRNKVL